jgi:hypothetical protein
VAVAIVGVNVVGHELSRDRPVKQSGIPLQRNVTHAINGNLKDLYQARADTAPGFCIAFATVMACPPPEKTVLMR